ncbi:MAG: fibronectin type III-like domain-contianing protein, partial [Bacteroidales bacterium]|nr:fibronectin type III-like domain-contianing protein [Bacteroidales bacterium]
HGLSYTTFSYDGASLSRKSVSCAGNFPVNGGTNEVLKVSVTVSNTGSLDGAEVVQLYVVPPAGSVERPSKELRGFEKIALAAGQSGSVSLSLPRRAFSRFDADAHEWVVDPGQYTIQIGSSSADIRCSLTVEIK